MSGVFFLLGTAMLVLNSVRPLGAYLSLPDALYIIALYFLVADGLIKTRPIARWIPIHPLWGPSLMVLVGGLLSTPSAIAPGTSVLITLKQWFVFSVWISMGIALTRRGLGERIILALILGSVFTSSVAIYDYLVGGNLGARISGETELRWGRYSGTMGHPNELSLITVVVIPLMLNWLLRWFLDRKDRDARGRILVPVFTGVLVLLATGNVLAGSVAGYVGAAVSSLIVLAGHLTRALTRSAFRHVVEATAILFVVLALVSAGLVEGGTRLSERVRDALDRAVNITGVSRLSVSQDALAYVARSPLVGAGMDQSGTGDLDPDLLVTSAVVHNTILQSWVAGGVIAFLGALLLYWRTLRQARQAALAWMRGDGSPLTLGLSASIVGWMIVDMVQPHIYHRYTWLTVAVLYGLVWRTTVAPIPDGAREPSPPQPVE